MQIYYTARSPYKCALNLPDQLTYKILTEISQLISKFLWESGIEAPCKHIAQGKAFCSWITESEANWNWLIAYASFLNKEYKVRYDKTDDCKSWLKIMECIEIGKQINWNDRYKFTEPPISLVQNTPVEILNNRLNRDTTRVYQEYLNWKIQTWKAEGKHKRLYSWTNRSVPEFIK